mgnify:CR=1 FL=1
MIVNKIKYFIRLKCVVPILLKGKPKVFCIGMNKTGTTSLKKAFEDLGFLVGSQRAAEMLLKNYIKNDCKPIFKYVKSAQVFQDIPFSLPNTYKFLYNKFPNAYFILTVRDSPEQWVDSITRFHSKLFGNGKIPTKKQLEEANYVYKGFMWNAMKSIAPISDENPYDREVLAQAYLNYNKEVEKFFKKNNCRFIKINLSEKGSYQKLIDFLGITSPFDDFPWENKTSEIKSK